MKIGDESFDNFKIIARINKNLSISLLWHDIPVVTDRAFDNSDRRRTYAYHPSALSQSAVNNFSIDLVDLKVFAVHFMIKYFVLFDRSKRTQPHVEQNFGDLHAHTFNFFKKLRRKVQTCGGSRSRPVYFAIDRLISAFVFKFLGDIRRKGHISYYFKYVFKDAVKYKLDKPYSLVSIPNDLALHCAKVKLGADFQLFCRSSDTFPHVVLLSFK